MSVSSAAGGFGAAAASFEAKPLPAASSGSRAQPNRILGIIARPHSKSRPECVRSVAKLWPCAMLLTLRERHGRAQRVIAPDDPAIHAPLGLVKEDVDARARRCVSRSRA